jgi:DNA modification methylase
MDTNVIYCGDCLVKLKDIPNKSIDLIYIDPPFSSNRNYVAFWKEQEKRHFEDRFENVKAYLDYMYPRVKELYRVLKDTGSFYYHCDSHASHYIKVLLDRDDLFGFANFRNEIIWKRTSAHSDSKKFGEVTDSILVYSKSSKRKWNKVTIGHDEAYTSAFYRFHDEKGQYRLHEIIRTASMGARPNLVYEYKGYTPQWGWRMERGKLEILDGEGRLVWSKSGRPYRKTYLPAGQSPTNLWIDIGNVSAQARERLGYPTQKPIALLERIILSSSNENDIVLDAFCGCGTTLIASQKNKRRWVGIDISPTACRVVAQRLEHAFGLREAKDFQILDMPKTVEELRAYPAFEFQNWVINALGGVPNKVKVRDRGIDGKLYPIEDIKKKKKTDSDMFGIIDRYIPIQVKRTDQVGSPDIENFEVAMKRDKRIEGIFIGFDFSRDALKEIRRAERDEGLLIEPKTVSQIVEGQLDKSLL